MRFSKQARGLPRCDSFCACTMLEVARGRNGNRASSCFSVDSTNRSRFCPMIPSAKNNGGRRSTSSRLIRFRDGHFSRRLWTFQKAGIVSRLEAAAIVKLLFDQRGGVSRITKFKMVAYRHSSSLNSCVSEASGCGRTNIWTMENYLQSSLRAKWNVRKSVETRSLPIQWEH